MDTHRTSALLILLVDLLCFTVLAYEDSGKKGQGSEKSDKLLKRGFKNWEERCLLTGGEQVLDDYLFEQENLIYCMLKQFDLEELQTEMSAKKKTGDLDLVFKKYCRDHVPAARECLVDFLSVSALCLPEEDRPGLNITLAMVDSAIEFTCHNDGDRIALFISEEGVECVTAHQQDMLTCVRKSVPEAFSPMHRRRSHNSMHFYVFQKENCRKGDAIIECVEKSLLKCSDPTPSNLLHGLLQSMREVTPCSVNAAPSTYACFLSRFVPSLVLIVVWFGMLSENQGL